jgi:hypothetical protein
MEPSEVEVRAGIALLQTKNREHLDACKMLEKQLMEAKNLLAFKTASVFVVVSFVNEFGVYDAVIYGVSSETSTQIAKNFFLTLDGVVAKLSYEFTSGWVSCYLKVGGLAVLEIRDPDRKVFNLFTVRAYATNAEAEAGKMQR